MPHKVSRTLCKRTVLSLSPHSINVLLANLVSEKCSESVGHKEGREGEKRISTEEEIRLVATERGSSHLVKGGIKKLYNSILYWMISICLNFNHVTSKMNAVFFTVIVYFSITCSPKPTPTTGALYTKHVFRYDLQGHSQWLCGRVHSEDCCRHLEWHIPENWLDPNKTPVLTVACVYDLRKVSGSFHVNPDTGFLWSHCQMLCCVMMLVSQMLRGKSVTHRFMTGD